MISFFLSLTRLLVAIRHGIQKDDEFRALLLILLMMLVGATLFYWRIEGWSIIDSVYFSVMTMSTIGYGDLVPTSVFSKLFTIIFALLSIGVFVAVVSKLVKIILAQRKITREHRKHIKHPRGHMASDENRQGPDE